MQREMIRFAVAALLVSACVSTANGATIWGVDSNSSGGAGNDAVVRFDSANPAGTITIVGHTGVSGFSMSGLDFDAAGTLWAVSSHISSTGSLYTIDQTDGHATLVGGLGIPSNRDITDLTYNPVTGQLVGVAFDGQRNYLYTINKISGAAALVGEINSPGSIFLGICADSAGRLYLEEVGGQMRRLNGLIATPMSDQLGVFTLFSQGMTMDWTRGDAWYLAATFQTIPGSFFAAGDVRLIDNTTGGTQQVLGTWPQLPNDQYPIYAIGDVAVRPVPEPALAGLLAILVALRQRRRRRRAPSTNGLRGL